MKRERRERKNHLLHTKANDVGKYKKLSNMATASKYEYDKI